MSEADELGATHGPRIALGLAMGTFSPQGDWFGGSSIDRAQLLAGLANHGELVLDEPTRDAVEMTYLFGRSIGSGVSPIRGFAIDRSVPRRSACRAWIRELKPATQFILATHNANIPVLGDAEQVIACEYHDNQIVLVTGSIDCADVRQRIVSIMEGGAEAFEKRKQVYEAWKPKNS